MYNLAQNQALQMGLPLALVLLLKNSQLLFQMAANTLFSGERYSRVHGAAAVCVTVGVCIAIFSKQTAQAPSFAASAASSPSASSSSISSSSSSSSSSLSPLPPLPPPSSASSASFSFFAACLCMVLANVARSVSNIGTQKAFARFGPFTAEKVWYEHMLGLPPLLLLSGGADAHAARWRSWSFEHVVDVTAWARGASSRGSALGGVVDRTLGALCSTAVVGPTLTAALSKFPVLWWYLFLSMVSTFLCTRACARLVSLSDSVFLSLVLAVQRFASIAFSAAVVNAPPYPPLTLWLGASLVAVGCISFIQLPPPRRHQDLSRAKLKQG